MFEGGNYAVNVRGRASGRIVARAKLRSTTMKQMILIRMAVMCVATSALALTFLLVGCAHEVSHSKTSSVSSNGTVKSTEKIVTESPDGTLTKTEESKKTTPR